MLLTESKKADFPLKNIFWSSKAKTKYFSTKTSLKITVQDLTENLYFRVGNVLQIQTFDIRIVTDPAPFWANLNLYNYESKYIANLIITNMSIISDFIVILLTNFVS